MSADGKVSSDRDTTAEGTSPFAEAARATGVDPRHPNFIPYRRPWTPKREAAMREFMEALIRASADAVDKEGSA